MRVIRAEKFYNREEIEKDSKTMYIFTDNTDRDSGKGEIPEDSWYSRKYGTSKHFPKVTSALIRGLHNAYPITTQRWYNNAHKGIYGRWNDEDLEEFRMVINDDFDEIIKNMGNYDRIVFPVGGIFNSKIADISESRVPKLYLYLKEKCIELMKDYEKTV